MEKKGNDTKKNIAVLIEFLSNIHLLFLTTQQTKYLTHTTTNLSNKTKLYHFETNMQPLIKIIK